MHDDTRLYLLLGTLGAAIGLYWYSTTASGSVAFQSLATAIGVSLGNRGLRDHNPGNIRRTGDNWRGALSQQEVVANGGTWDSDFVQFSADEFGVRAFGHVLTTYAKVGINTVQDAVSRYAPASDGNDTVGYYTEVSAELNVAPGQIIDLYGSIPALATAMMKRETGYVGDPSLIAQWVYEA